MSTPLPLWIQYLQALATPAIALFAVGIGIMQWRTSHQRAALDLFEKRLDAYSSVRSVIGDIIGHGSVTNETLFSFLLAHDKARFLFGPEVTTYLTSLYKHLNDHHLAETMVNARNSDTATWIERQSAAFNEIKGFHERMDRLLRPYMLMTQKLPWI